MLQYYFVLVRLFQNSKLFQNNQHFCVDSSNFLKSLKDDLKKIKAIPTKKTYKITCLKNGKVYVGESQNVFHRLGRHTTDLQENRHDCPELQQNFNKYGKNAFKFESLTVDSKYADYRLRK